MYMEGEILPLLVLVGVLKYTSGGPGLHSLCDTLKLVRIGNDDLRQTNSKSLKERQVDGYGQFTSKV